jgi:hypothetical protein
MDDERRLGSLGVEITAILFIQKKKKEPQHAVDQIRSARPLTIDTWQWANYPSGQLGSTRSLCSSLPTSPPLTRRIGPMN